MNANTNSVSSTVEMIKQRLVTFGTDYGKDVIGALIILTVGVMVARWLGKVLNRSLERKGLEPSLRMLCVRVVRLLIMAFTLVAVLDKFGVPTTSIIAGIGVAGVGIGLALQGVLGNLVAGLTIIFTKPFRVGEYIELLGVHGQVTDIELFSTSLVHSDRSIVVVPNRKIVGEILHNYGTIRQLDLSVGVAYGTNLSQALDVVRDVLKNNPRVLKELSPGVGVAVLNDSSVTISVRPWVNVPDCGPAQAEIYQAIVEQFRASKIEIPFPQREVRLLNSVEARK